MPDQAAEPPRPGELVQALEHRLHLCRIGHIGRQQPDPAAMDSQLAGQSLGGSLVLAEIEGQVVPARCQQTGGGRANAARTTGDQGQGSWGHACIVVDNTALTCGPSLR